MAQRSSTDRAWRAVHRAADMHRPRVRRAVLRALLRGQRKVSAISLIAALERNDPGEVWRILLPALATIESAMRTTLPSILFDCLVDGGKAALDRQGRVIGASTATGPRAAATKKSAPTPAPTMSFDKTNPRARAWAAQHSSTMIVEVGQKTKAAVRAIIDRAFAQRMAPRVTARYIKQQVGLTDRMAQSVEARRIALVERGVEAERAAAQAARYADQLVRRRALNIARTETITASCEGQRQLWLQAADAGLITKTQRRRWITTPGDRTCKRCMRMDQQTAGLTEPFKEPVAGGKSVMGPTLHPQCRCAVRLVARAS